MGDAEFASVGIAVVRAVVEDGQRPVIRILEVADVLGDEHVLGMTTSPEEAAEIVVGWLRSVIANAGSARDPGTER